jgi:hypothetical protein
MKMILGFFIGTTTCLAMMLCIIHYTSPVSAQTPTPEPTPTDTIDVNGLMPDVKGIYNTALGEPYRQVKSEINDPDVANYFQKYLEKTGLDKIGANK